VTRLLPAHALALAAVAGLAAANVARPGLFALLLVLALVCAVAVAAVAPMHVRLAALAALVAVAGWGWGALRLDALDRSPLHGFVGTAGRALLEVTGEPRPGTFVQRLPARVLAFDGRPVGGERAQLELPLGRAPPQGARISALVVVREPRGASGGFDERTWLRRQGIHVVLKVDAWTVVGRRHGLGGVSDRLRRWLARGSGPGLAGERRAVLEGILLGDSAQLSPEMKTSFQRSGLFHLLSVAQVSRRVVPRRAPSATAPVRAGHVEGDADPNARHPGSEGLHGQGRTAAGARLEPTVTPREASQIPRGTGEA
jgi:predicted membrane metal-binding protein